MQPQVRSFLVVLMLFFLSIETVSWPGSWFKRIRHRFALHVEIHSFPCLDLEWPRAESAVTVWRVMADAERRQKCKWMNVCWWAFFCRLSAHDTGNNGIVDCIADDLNHIEATENAFIGNRVESFQLHRRFIWIFAARTSARFFKTNCGETHRPTSLE